MDAADEDWENVGSTSVSYTPKLADVGSYLRAVVDYTDVEYDEPDTAMGVTKFAVRARPVCQRCADDSRPVDRDVSRTRTAPSARCQAKDDDELIYRLRGDDDPDG